MRYVFITLLILLVGCSQIVEEEKMVNLDNPNLKRAVFAGGCFWCTEAAFEKEDGVIEAISGYIGGNEEDAVYDKVSSGKTEHFEASQVIYDPTLISYEKLLEVFWLNIDPTDDGGQFADRGSQYYTAVFYEDEDQKKVIEKSIQEEQKNYDDPIITKVLPLMDFYEAEEYHQDYYKKAETRYKLYEAGSGRKKYVEEKKMREKELLKERLTPLQYKVTQEDGTEPAFNNEYWDNKEEGIYVDVVDGTPLFSSKDKFDSKTGWPSFTKPIDENVIVQKEDSTLGMKRVEVEGKKSGSHLGHVFNDGPQPTGERFCMNSASLKFIPKEDLEKEGYEEYKEMFD